MKEIRAYIEPLILLELTQALLDLPDFPGMRTSDCLGCPGAKEVNENSEFELFMKKKRIDIFAPDEMVDSIISILRANNNQHCIDNIYLINTTEIAPISLGSSIKQTEKF